MRFVAKQPFTARYIGGFQSDDSGEVQIPVGHADGGEYISLSRADFDQLFTPYIEPVPETAFERAKRLQSEAIAAAQEVLTEGIKRSEEFQAALKKFLGRE